jgi:DNA invertase Pin-like site-specific DNA recombinase
MSDPIRSAVYARATVEGGCEQLRLCHEFIEQRGWQKVGPDYLDLQVGTASDRSALKELLADAERGDVDRVVASDLSRLARSLSALEMLTKTLQKNNVALVVVMGNCAILTRRSTVG